MSKEREIDGTLHLELSTRFEMEPAQQPIPYTGQIVLETEDGDYRVGWVKYSVLPVLDMLARGENPYFALDMMDDDTADFMEFFDSKSQGWSEAVLHVWEDAPLGNLVILDRLVVYPPFRGKEIGLLCLGTLTRLIGWDCLYVMRPMPLQYLPGHAKDRDVAKTAGKKAADVRKLMAYYAKAGFREIPGTGQMALDGSVEGPMDKRKGSWAEVTLERTAAMEDYRLPEREISSALPLAYAR